jgi:ATP-dependent helicase/nuclease subunit B
VRFLLGPAGTGKTFQCLAEIRQALRADFSGPPLILLAPRQATFQLERQLLCNSNGVSISGYTRLQILSFQRLAAYVLEQSGGATPNLLSEDGRSMVLHALLARRRKDLKIFHPSAGLAGFARQLSAELRELQRRQLSPEALRAMAAGPGLADALRRKLQDLSLLLTEYLDWLRQHDLQDTDSLLDLAREALKRSPAPPSIGELWLDGFAEMTPQELDLLASIAARCEKLTLAFCVEGVPVRESSWLSIWTGIEKTVRQCWDRLSAVPGAQLTTEILSRDNPLGRFKDSPALRHLESKWTHPSDFSAPLPPESLRAVICSTPQAEAVMAAQEILRFVRSGGRFREIAVLLRAMEGYHDTLRRVFSRYGIPFFMDRREKVAQHPLAELTRCVLRAAAFGWRHDDWFGALKTGLVSPDEEQIDRLENEALYRGWSGDTWFSPLPPDKAKSDWAERLREKWIAPFSKFRRLTRPTGPQLAEAIRQLWRDLNVEEKLEEWSADEGKTGVVHATVWRQFNTWLDDLALAFAGEPMPLADWMPILEAGLADLSVGVIPPALDQVLVGTIDRSRNPDLKLVILLGVNETVFPATPDAGNLLNEADRDELARNDIRLGPSRREFLGRERFFGYIACTRSRQRLVIACSEHDAGGAPLNPSPFFSHLKSLFATLEIEKFTGANWQQAEHFCEVSGQLARAARPGPNLSDLLGQPAFAVLREQIAAASAEPGRLPPEIVAKLYGPALHTSVSRLEEFAACSFKFFVHSGLRAEERQRFELDVRERGSFQHEVLALFHTQLREQNKNWRDISPAEARARVKDCVAQLQPKFRDGLLAASAQSRFAARAVASSLQDFIAATVEWMEHYRFDPHESELGFGTAGAKLPAWDLDLGAGRRLIFRGKIDRVDLCRKAGGDEAMAVVIDYKSGALKLDEVLMANGLQLQLAAYLSVLRRLADAREHFGVSRIVPVGVFYINLRGQTESGKTRSEVLQSREDFRRRRFQHLGRFDESALIMLDSSGASEGSQFKFRINKDGSPHAGNKDLVKTRHFQQMLDHVEAELLRMGREIYEGAIAPNPYQKGGKLACDNCDYMSICRFDPWTQPYRHLKAARE